MLPNGRQGYISTAALAEATRRAVMRPSSLGTSQVIRSQTTAWGMTAHDSGR